MKSASISELKATLKVLPQAQLTELCLRLARFKKDNKELLTFLLYEADDLTAYLNAVKKEMDDDMTSINTGNLHWIKKSLRKMLRAISKYSKHTGSKESAVEMLLHFCIKLKNSGIRIHRNKALSNLYSQQLKKLNALVEMVHEDLAFDYKKQLEELVE